MGSLVHLKILRITVYCVVSQTGDNHVLQALIAAIALACYEKNVVLNPGGQLPT